jgi:phosphoinositide-3-kinase regulatory subunit 4
MDGSSTSLNLMPPPPRPVIRRDSQSSVTSGVNSSATSDLSSLAQRLDTTSTLPSSENVLSGIAMSPSALRSKGILHLGGMDTQKASAAVGSVRTNATGLLEPPTKLHPVDENHTPSGRSSPLSAVGTVKADQASKPSSSNRPFSTTYGESIPVVLRIIY